jgi:hypothetical protein
MAGIGAAAQKHIGDLLELHEKNMVTTADIQRRKKLADEASPAASTRCCASTTPRTTCAGTIRPPSVLSDYVASQRGSRIG